MTFPILEVMGDGVGYLAQPYTHRSCDCVGPCIVEEERYIEAIRATAWLISRDVKVISPIAMYHRVAQAASLDPSWGSWEESAFALLDRCDWMACLTLDGWEESEGLVAERRRAFALDMPIHLLDVDTMEAPCR